MGGVSRKEGVGVQRVEEEEEEWATRRGSSGVDCVVCGEVEVGRGGGGGKNGEERKEEGRDEGGGGGKEVWRGRKVEREVTLYVRKSSS